jgi:ribonuclease E
MSTPHPDDSWAELYNELGLEPETLAPKAAPPEPEPEPFAESVEESEEYAESVETDGDAEADAEGEAEPAEGEATEEGAEPGKKKRRRRRRRRGGKRDDAPESATEGDAAEGEPEAATSVLDDHDGPGPEAAQQLIANWDVPSWGEIVAGLYRPSGSGR